FTDILFLQSSVSPLSLHSFPTRRSSDLLVRRLVTSGRDCLHWGSGVRCSASDGFLLDHWPYHLALPRVGKTRWRRDGCGLRSRRDRKSTRLNSSHLGISYAVFCLKKKNS